MEDKREQAERVARFFPERTGVVGSTCPPPRVLGVGTPQLQRDLFFRRLRLGFLYFSPLVIAVSSIHEYGYILIVVLILDIMRQTRMKVSSK